MQNVEKYEYDDSEKDGVKCEVRKLMVKEALQGRLRAQQEPGAVL